MESQETQKEANTISGLLKVEAKKIKEEGNAHYRKEELDLAIQKYDEVILTQKMGYTPKRLSFFKNFFFHFFV